MSEFIKGVSDQGVLEISLEIRDFWREKLVSKTGGKFRALKRSLCRFIEVAIVSSAHGAKRKASLPA